MFFWAASTPILSFTTLSPSINFDDADNVADENDDGGDDNDDDDDDDDGDDDGGNQREGRTRITLVLHTMPEKWLNKEDFNTMRNHLYCCHHRHRIFHQHRHNELIFNGPLWLKTTL